MSDSHPSQKANRQRIYTHLEQYDIELHTHDSTRKEAKPRKASKQARSKKSSSKGKPRTIPQFRVKKYNHKLLDKLVSLLGYTIQSADKAMQYIPLSTYFDANFQTRLYYSDRDNLMNWLNALKVQNDVKAVDSFAEARDCERYQAGDEMHCRVGEDAGKRGVRSKSQANPDYQFWLEANQQYNSLPQPHKQPQNDIQCQSCRSFDKKHHQLSSVKTQTQKNPFSSTHNYIDQSKAQEIRSDIDKLKSDIEELRKMKQKAQNGETVFFEERISIVEEVYQKGQDRMNSSDKSGLEEERNAGNKQTPQKQRKSHRIKIPQQEFNLLKQIQKQYNQIQSLIRQKSANLQSRSKSPKSTESKQQRNGKSFHYNPLMRKASLLEEVDQLVGQLEQKARCQGKDCEGLTERKRDKSCERETYRQMQLEVEECNRKCDELKRHNDDFRRANEQLKRTNNDLNLRLQPAPSPRPHNESHSYHTKLTIIQPQPHDLQSLTTANNKISRLETQLSVCKNNFKAFFTIIKNTLMRYPTINGQKLDEKLIEQLKDVQAKEAKVEKGMEILVKLLDSIVAENTKLRIDAEARQDASNKSFTYIETRIQRNVNSHILDELERSRHSIEHSRHQKHPQTTKTITTTNTDHQQQLEALQVELYSKDQTILKLSELLQSKELELSKLKIHVEKHEEHKHQTNKMLTNQHLTLEELRYLLEERDFELGKVRQELETKDQDMKELQKYLNKVETHAVTLREQNSKLKDNLDQYSRQLTALQQEKNAIMEYVSKLQRKEKKYEQVVSDKDNQILQLKNILRQYENCYQELEQRYYEEIESRLDDLGRSGHKHAQSHEKSQPKGNPRADREKGIDHINSNKPKQNHPILISEISPHELYDNPTSNKRHSSQSLDHQQGPQSSQLSQDIDLLLQEKDEVIEKLREENQKLNQKLQNNLQLMLTFRNQCNDLQTQINILNEISSTGKDSKSNDPLNNNKNNVSTANNQQPTHPQVIVSSVKTVHKVTSKRSDSLQPQVIKERSQREEESSRKTVHNEFTPINGPLNHFEQPARPKMYRQGEQEKQSHQLEVSRKRSFDTSNDRTSVTHIFVHRDSPNSPKLCQQCGLKLTQIDKLQRQNDKLKSQISKLQQKAYEQAIRIEEQEEDKAQLLKALNRAKPNRSLNSKLQTTIPEQEQDTYDNSGHNHTHQDSSQGNSDAFYRYHNMINEQRKNAEECDHKDDDPRSTIKQQLNSTYIQQPHNQIHDNTQSHIHQTLSSDSSSDKQPAHDSSYTKLHPNNVSFNDSPNQKSQNSKRKKSADSQHNISDDGIGNNTSHKQRPSTLLNELQLEGFRENQQLIDMSNHVSSRDRDTSRSREPMPDKSIASVVPKQQLTDRPSNQDLSRQLNDSKANFQSGKSLLYLANRYNEQPQARKEGASMKESERDNDNEWQRQQIRQIKQKMNQRSLESRRSQCLNLSPHHKLHPLPNGKFEQQQFYQEHMNPARQAQFKAVQCKSQELKDLESIVRELQVQNQELRSETEQIKKRADDKEDQYIKQSGQYNHLLGQYHTKYEQLTTANDNSVQLETQVKTLQSKLKQLQNELQSLKAQKESLEQSLDVQIQQTQRLQSAVNEAEHAERENARLNKEVSKLNGDVEALRQDFNRARVENERLNSEQSKLSNQVEQLTEQNKNLQQRIKQNEGQLEQQKSQFLDLVSKVQSYNTQALTHQKQINSKNNQIQTLKKQIHSLKKSLSSQTRHSTQLKSENEQLGRQNNQLKQEVKKLKGQVAELQGELVQFQQEMTHMQLKLAQVKGINSSVEDSKVIEQLKTKVISLMNIINQKESLIKQNQHRHTKSLSDLSLNISAKDQLIAQLNQQILTLKSSIKAIQDSINDDTPSIQGERFSSNDKRLARSQRVIARSNSGNIGCHNNARMNHSDPTYPLENMILKHKEEILSLHKLLREKDAQLKRLLQQINLLELTSTQPTQLTLPAPKSQHKYQPNTQTQGTKPIASQPQPSQQNINTSQLSDVSANITNNSSDLDQLRTELREVRNLLNNRENTYNQLLKDKDDQLQKHLRQTQRKLNTIEKINQTLSDQLTIKNNQIQSLKHIIQKKSTQLAEQNKTITQVRQQNLDNKKTIQKLINELTSTKKTLAKHYDCNLSSNTNDQNTSPLRNRSQSPVHSEHQPQQRQSFAHQSNQHTDDSPQNNSDYAQNTSGQKNPSKRSHSQHNKSEQQTNIATENNVLNLMSRTKDASQMNAINLPGKNELFEIHNFVKVYVKNSQNSSFIVTNHFPEQQYEFELSHHELIHGQEMEQKPQGSRKDSRNVSGSQKMTQMQQNSLEMSRMTNEKSFKSDLSLKQQNPREVQTSRVAFSQQGMASSSPKKLQESPQESPMSQIQPISYPATLTPSGLKQSQKEQQKTEKVKSVNSSNSKSGELNRFYLEKIVPQFFGKKKNTQSQQKDKK